MAEKLLLVTNIISEEEERVVLEFILREAETAKSEKCARL